MMEETGALAPLTSGAASLVAAASGGLTGWGGWADLFIGSAMVAAGGALAVFAWKNAKAIWLVFFSFLPMDCLPPSGQSGRDYH